jgi:GTP-binding protein Era
VLGILNLKAKKGQPAAQVALVDTPGVHKPDSQLNRRMMQEVQEALESRDLVLLIIDVTQRFGGGDQFVLDMLKPVESPVFLLLNKVDAVPKVKLLPLIEHYRRLRDFAEIIPISALKRQGLDLLMEKIVQHLPSGPRYFTADQITDQPERFMASEIIREKLLLATGQEVPYATAVRIDRWEEQPKLTRISATIYCEREGQKAILIGRRGEMLKKIGTRARLELEKLVGGKVFLELFVKVVPEWRSSRRFVEELDWRRQLEDIAASQAGQETSEPE